MALGIMFLPIGLGTLALIFMLGGIQVAIEETLEDSFCADTGTMPSLVIIPFVITLPTSVMIMSLRHGCERKLFRRGRRPQRHARRNFSCKTLLRPKPGDCCVFCSYGSVKCPPMQSENCACLPCR
jgi:hypothetical protein